MRWIRFLHQGKERYGFVEGDVVSPIVGDIFQDYKVTDEKLSLHEISLLAPIKPHKCIGIGLNYASHAKESNLPQIPDEPVMFMFSPTAVIGHESAIVLNRLDDRIDFEAELVLVIGKAGERIPREQARDYIFGYTCGNDVSNRTLQKKDGQFTRAKSFATYKPLGPWIETEVSDPNQLSIKLWQNGKLKQSASTHDLIFSVEEIVAYVSEVMRLEPGDVIFTGTPGGVDRMQPGDVIEIEIEGIGRLCNPVKG